MSHKRLGLMVGVLFLALCFSLACKSDTKSSLVGKWKSTTSEGWEFKSDNKFERMTPLGIPITGTYKVDGETVILTFDPKDKTSKAVEDIKVKITVSGDDMTLDEGERKYTYKRESAKAEPTPSLSPVALKKIFDAPSLPGKTPDEVKRDIGLVPKRESSSKEFDLQEYVFDGVGICQVYFTKGKFNRLQLSIDRVKFDTPEQLGDLVGIDLRGKTSSMPGEDIFSYDLTFNGVKVSVAFIKDTGTGFNSFRMDTL